MFGSETYVLNMYQKGTQSETPSIFKMPGFNDKFRCEMLPKQEERKRWDAMFSISMRLMTRWVGFNEFRKKLKNQYSKILAESRGKSTNRNRNPEVEPDSSSSKRRATHPAQNPIWSRPCQLSLKCGQN